MSVTTQVEPRSVMGKIRYLIRDPKHDFEKPYHLYYTHNHSIPPTNTVGDDRYVPILNARRLETPQRDLFFERGFTMFPLHCSLHPNDYLDEERVKQVLYPECESIARSLYPEAVRVEFLEHTTRKRDPKWTSSISHERQNFSTSQPSDYGHIDFTASSAEKSAIKQFGIQPTDYERFIILNFWKPIKGPVYDWPLTLCDRRTVSHESQTIANDVVTKQYVNENFQIYYHPDHTWYYWPGLRNDEVIVFMQADSKAPDASGVPHTSFWDPHTPTGVDLRESIEVRMYVYFDKQ